MYRRGQNTTLRVGRIPLARCTLSPFLASQMRTLRPLRRHNRKQKGSKPLQSRLSRARPRALCPATSSHRASSARTRCRIRTGRVVLRMGTRLNRRVLDRVWGLVCHGRRRLRRRRCRDSLRRCAWVSRVSARDREGGRGRLR
jgi:hypothetical protein